MFEIKVEAQFKADYKRTMCIHPQLKSEFKAAVAELVAHGSLPAEYGRPRALQPGRQLQRSHRFSSFRWPGRRGRSLPAA